MEYPYLPPLKPAGYCRYHDRNMSYRYIRGRKCLGRQGPHLFKYMSHPVWEQRRRLKEKKKRLGMMVAETI